MGKIWALLPSDMEDPTQQEAQCGVEGVYTPVPKRRDPSLLLIESINGRLGDQGWLSGKVSLGPGMTASVGDVPIIRQGHPQDSEATGHPLVH
jgi:hypothetical protein